MRRKRKHLEPLCDVQGMSVTTRETETDHEDCNTTRMLTCSPSVFKSLHTLSGFALVLRVVNSIVVAVTIYSIFDLYANSL